MEFFAWIVVIVFMTCFCFGVAEGLSLVKPNRDSPDYKLAQITLSLILTISAFVLALLVLL